MIRQIRFRNFKSLRHCDLTLEPLTLLVGHNGSGKTSILEGIEFISKLLPQIQVVDTAGKFSLNELYSIGGTEAMEIVVQQDCGDIRLVLSNDGSVSSWDRVAGQTWGYKVAPGMNAAEYKQQVEELTSTGYFQLSANEMSRTSYSDKVVPELGHDGNGLASVLQFMAINDRAMFEEIQSRLRLIVPTFQEIGFVRAPVELHKKEIVRFGNESVERMLNHTVMGESLLLSFQGAKQVPASRASEGTILALGILTLLRCPKRCKVLLLDDLEHGLHPLAQEQLIEAIKLAIASDASLQVIATTHSPYLLDYTPKESVRLIMMGSDGGSVVGKLSDHPKFEKWKEELASGEMWSLFGENWLSEGVRQ